MELTIFTDGGARGNPGPAAWGFVVFSDQQLVYEEAAFIGVGTNNEAEYQALVASMQWLATFEHLSEVTHITWKLDSKLVVEQVNRRWKVKELRLQEYVQRCQAVIQTLTAPIVITHIPRAENSHADALVNKALDEARS